MTHFFTLMILQTNAPHPRHRNGGHDHYSCTVCRHPALQAPTGAAGSFIARVSKITSTLLRVLGKPQELEAALLCRISK